MPKPASYSGACGSQRRKRQGLIIAKDDRKADRLQRIHQADQDGLAVHLVADAPIAGDDIGGGEDDGVEEMLGGGFGGGSAGAASRDGGARARALSRRAALRFFDAGIRHARVRSKSGAALAVGHSIPGTY